VVSSATAVLAKVTEEESAVLEALAGDDRTSSASLHHANPPPDKEEDDDLLYMPPPPLQQSSVTATRHDHANSRQPPRQPPRRHEANGSVHVLPPPRVIEEEQGNVTTNVVGRSSRSPNKEAPAPEPLEATLYTIPAKSQRSPSQEAARNVIRVERGAQRRSPTNNDVQSPLTVSRSDSGGGNAERGTQQHRPQHRPSIQPPRRTSSGPVAKKRDVDAYGGCEQQ
jgi:hypothetical protein